MVNGNEKSGNLLKFVYGNTKKDLFESKLKIPELLSNFQENKMHLIVIKKFNINKLNLKKKTCIEYLFSFQN